MRFFAFIFLILPLVAIATSCGSSSGGGNEAFATNSTSASSLGGEGGQRSKLNERFSGNYKYETDADGNSRIVSDQKTYFDRDKSFSGAKAFQGKKNHNTNKVFQATEWQGARDHQRQAYQSNTKAADHLTRRSRVEGQTSYYNGSRAYNDGKSYKKSQYGTKKSRYGEKQLHQGERTAGYVETQRGSYDNLKIIQREKDDKSKYTLDEVKRILGRDGEE